jgi:glycosyltransferase involved in cell wall biosynthesis
VIVGDGDDKPRLESMACERGVRHRVIFVGSVNENGNGDEPFALIDWYRTADVFVMPSTGEGFGIVFLEALACGLPVVAGNEDGSRDALLDGALGTIIDPMEKNQLIDAVLTAIDTTVNRDSLQIFSKDRFQQRVGQILGKQQ